MYGIGSTSGVLGEGGASGAAGVIGTGGGNAGVALTAASLVLVTLQQHATGVYVLAAVPNVSASSFTVYLSKAVTAAAKVAWFVVN